MQPKLLFEDKDLGRAFQGLNETWEVELPIEASLKGFLEGLMAEERPHFLNALAAASNGRFIPVPGGVLIRDADGDVIGSVGVSGDTSDNDAACAVAGIEAAGLTADDG